MKPISKATFRKQMGLVQHRPKKLEVDESKYGLHVCPACWRCYKYQPVLAPEDWKEMGIQAGITYICSECAK